MQKRGFDNFILIAGAGLTGLMSALKLTQIYPDRRIVVFDKSAQVGGLYASRLYPEDIRYDNGMHVIYESCNPEVDELYREVMPETEWNIYEGNEKDIAGLFFRGRLQTYSHYVDLRSFPSDVRKSFVGSLFQNLEACEVTNPKSAIDFLRNQFGKEVVEIVHRPILKMMYGVDPENLDLFATKVTALERVTLFDPTTMLDLMKSSMLRARLAFPDQLNLPPLRENTQKALYPKKFGMSYFVDRLRDHLHNKGVEILTQTDILEIRQHEGRIADVTLTNKEWGTRTLDVGRMLWTAGWPSLARQLGVDISDLKFHRGPEMIFMNLAFDRPLAMDRLYYFYCYDEGFASFRVTNYANYCPAAAQDGRFPMCVELWPSKIGKKRADLGQDECVRLAVDELRRFGVIGQDHKLLFSRMESNVGEFPMPTLENTNSLQAIRTRVAERRIGNLSVAGVMAKDGLFFIPDILNDAFSKLHDF
jgi:protoporphyrinogen oxidase